jgi:nucleoside-diphosphate-sugar epimerase
MSGLRVVLGSGGIGGAVVGELLVRGYEVRAVSRHGGDAGPKDVEHAALDVSTPAGAAAACEEASAVYHCVQPPYHRWAEELPPINRAIAAAAASQGAKLVLADNLYMYGPIAGPISETSPQQPSSKKGRLRKEAADALLREHDAGRLRLTIGRAADYFGPGGRNSIAGEPVFGAAVAGTAVRWPASADQPRSFSYVPDLARALVTLGENDAADGKAWILPHASPLTARELVGLIGRAQARGCPISGTSSRRPSSPTTRLSRPRSGTSTRRRVSKRFTKRWPGFALGLADQVSWRPSEGLRTSRSCADDSSGPGRRSCRLDQTAWSIILLPSGSWKVANLPPSASNGGPLNATPRAESTS